MTRMPHKGWPSAWPTSTGPLALCARGYLASGCQGADQAFQAAGLRPPYSPVTARPRATGWPGAGSRRAGQGVADGKLAYPQGPGGGRGYQHHGGDGISDAPVLCPRLLRHGGRYGSGEEQRRRHPCWRTISPACWPPAPWRCAPARSSRRTSPGPSVYNLLVLPLAASGCPYLAAAGMSLSSLIVVTKLMLAQSLIPAMD